MNTPCWNCREPVSPVPSVTEVPGVPTCVGCGVIQAPPPRPEPFSIFGLAPRWHLDLEALDARWKLLARKIHPDRFAGKSPAERRFALSWTASMNEARRILRDPTRRAWLVATGVPSPPETGARVDPAFLNLIFAWREADEDEPGSFARLSAARRAELSAALDETFSAWETGAGTLDTVPALLHRLSYLAGHAPAEG